MYVKNKLILLFLFLSFFCVSVSQAQSIKRIKMDELVKMIHQSKEPLVVNFWASWCQPCIHEIPWFEKNINALKDKK